MGFVQVKYKGKWVDEDDYKKEIVEPKKKKKTKRKSFKDTFSKMRKYDKKAKKKSKKIAKKTSKAVRESRPSNPMETVMSRHLRF